jgi:asparaginyl-tRNA synthetase
MASKDKEKQKMTDKEQDTKTVFYKPAHTPLVELFSRSSDSIIGQVFMVCGHVRSSQAKFVHIYDGTTPKSLQLVLTKDQMTAVIAKHGHLHASTTVSARVVIQKSQGKKQEYDGIVQQDSFSVRGIVRDVTDFLPAIGKKISMDTWRQHCDLRAHSRTQAAIFRIRSRLSMATTDFMRSKHVLHEDPNTITSADCEGAGEMFIVTTLGEGGLLSSIPTRKETLSSSKEKDKVKEKEVAVKVKEKEKDQEKEAKDEPKKIDWRRDFFANDEPARLTVSSQLQLEALCAGLGAVYTTNPSYRAEKSKTTRHLASFTHVEAEIPFIEFKDLMDFEEEYVVTCFQTILKDCIDDLAVLESAYAPGCTDKLRWFVQERFDRISYDDAIKILEKDSEKVKKFIRGIDGSGSKKEQELPKWGQDLGSHCERYLAEAYCKRPVFVYNMPAILKSFYMKRNPDGRTVQGCDLLIPGMGELIGGSMRENDYLKLARTMIERKMCTTKTKAVESGVDPQSKEAELLIYGLDFGSLQWYLNLRRNASTPTGGFGLGFERLVTVCTSNLEGANIRDSLAFPVAFRECTF